MTILRELLSIMITVACFYFLGRYVSLIMTLAVLVIATVALFVGGFKALLLIQAYPGAFLFLSFLVISRNSSGVG